MAEGYVADTPDDALADMYDTPADFHRAATQGISARIISWDEYERDYFERMRPGYVCPHV